MSLLADLAFEARNSARSVADYMSGNPLRLGVTGLSRAGKTVFITALVQALTGRGGYLPVFQASTQKRVKGGVLQAQPDDAMPRFAIEDHLTSLEVERRWPESTRSISELRIKVDYERRTGWRPGPASLTLDIVDYPGEWLLDLPLLEKSYAQWSEETLEASAAASRAPLAAAWRGHTALLGPDPDASEDAARRCAELFTQYLLACRSDRFALSTLPPGRFLMPGDRAGSAMLTFAPLPGGGAPRPGSLAATMERRYESYKAQVVKPFFRDHFSRLDRQIVLVDALSALNSGPAAVRDLQKALGDVLQGFRAGRSSLLSTLFRPRIDKILFAATKADHLHHTNHDRLEEILKAIVARAIAKAEGVGAQLDFVALAAIRATAECQVPMGGALRDAIYGTPLQGEEVYGEIFDGVDEAAVIPAELPEDPNRVFRGDGLALAEGDNDFRFVRFRPPLPGRTPDGDAFFPHIRLDRALSFLLADRLT